MTLIEAIVLGIIQGLTEFLPVSSSGHLVLFQHLFGLTEPELLFDICVHVGTLAAVVAVFYKDLLAMGTGVIRLPAVIRASDHPGNIFRQSNELRMLAFIAAGCIPTALLGVFFADIAHRLFSSTVVVGLALCVTGLFLWSIRQRPPGGRLLQSMLWRDALIIGLAQGLAITPGISRSGATIAAALFLGLDRELAGRFSFLLAIPAILGALMLGLDGDAFRTDLPWGYILAGSLSAAIIGYLALRFLLRIVKNGQLHRFAPYCWAVGAVALLVAWF